jgi:hypothetical protein
LKIRLLFMTDNVEKSRKSIVFCGILRSPVKHICPDGILGGHLLLLTSIRSREYTFLVTSGTDSELSGRESRVTGKNDLFIPWTF